MKIHKFCCRETEKIAGELKSSSGGVWKRFYAAFSNSNAKQRGLSVSLTCVRGDKVNKWFKSADGKSDICTYIYVELQCQSNQMEMKPRLNRHDGIHAQNGNANDKWKYKENGLRSAATHWTTGWMECWNM